MQPLIIVVAIMSIAVVIVTVSMSIIFTVVAKGIEIPEPPTVKPGIDGDLHLLYDKRIGLVTNPSGVNHELESTIDILFHRKLHPRIKLNALFAPEHGIRGNYGPGVKFEDYTDPITKLNVYSLYNNNHTYGPSHEQLKDLDMLVLDLQDVGTRCFTYLSTMVECLKSAKNASIPFVILDRSNPIGARDNDVQGPVLEHQHISFIGIWSIPMQHAMTMGELARMFNHEMEINHPELYVVHIKQADPTQRSPDNVSISRKPLVYGNARWLPPSPNLPTHLTSMIYPGVVLFEATNLSLGRGTSTPFQLIGAPFIDGIRFAEKVSEKCSDQRVAHYFEHVHLIPTYFTPDSGPHRGKQCYGVRLVMTHPPIYESTRSIPMAVVLLQSLLELYGEDQLNISADYMNKLVGTDQLLKDLRARKPVPDIVESWSNCLEEFKKRRSKYLLY
ncbi:hypothetical protein AKO1_008960 [Acrasis kona]|uniref:DUF1343 domain-containing protein n=1 Tax=Acrasis kona TaxID=1008807 RepID=A0AAW2ZGK9_9EUKA